MSQYPLSDLTFKSLSEGEEIPYSLLLLADPSKEMIDGYLGPSQIYIAEQGGKIVGTMVLQPLGNNLIEIKNIAVLEELQGKGIGKYLIENAIQIAREMKMRYIQIGTANSSIGQLYLYQKMGFEIEGVKRNYFTDNYMEKIYENGIEAKHMIMLVKLL